MINKFPRRYVVCVLTFFGLFMLFAMRINLSIAIVAMTTSHSVILENGTTIEVTDFVMDSKLKGYILSSFFYGYLVSEIPCGWLSVRYGGVTVFGLEIVFAAIFTISLPLVANYGGAIAILIFRALAGIFEGGSYPCIQAIWSRWAPEDERNRLVSISYSASNFANIICLPVYGIMATVWGWQSLFYVSGIASLLWYIFWYIYITDDPANDSRITMEEMRYIQQSTFKKYEQLVGHPWYEILTSVPVWAVLTVFFCHTWGYFLLFTELPTYLNDVWHFNVKEAGLWLIVPYIPAILISPFAGVLADYLKNHRGLTTTTVRKLFQAIAGFGSAICIVLVAFSTSAQMSICFLTLVYAFSSFYYGSFLINPLDLAPKYASIIMGLAATFGSLSAIIGPVTTGYIVTHQSRSEWTVVFLICSVMYTVGTVFYLIFASGKLQPWAQQTVGAAANCQS